MLFEIKKVIEEQEIHIHNYPTGSSSKSSSGETSSSSGETSSSSDSNNDSSNSQVNQSSQSTQTTQGLQSQSQSNQSPSTDHKVSKFMNDRKTNVSSNDAKKNDNKSMKDFKEVFIRNHVRRYRRKPSIGLMKQTFGTSS